MLAVLGGGIALFATAIIGAAGLFARRGAGRGQRSAQSRRSAGQAPPLVSPAAQPSENWWKQCHIRGHTSSSHAAPASRARAANSTESERRISASPTCTNVGGSPASKSDGAKSGDAPVVRASVRAISARSGSLSPDAPR